MLKTRLTLAATLAGLMLALPLGGSVPRLPFGATAAQAQDATISFSVFFDNLAPQGRWIRHPRYSYVWCPTVDQTWAPYTHGHWVYIDGRGWYFDSDEPFAWAAYHYGRWYNDTDLGWCWVPGNIWAPAWVSWRKSNDYVGWAPLPPDDSGFSLGTQVSTQEEPRANWFYIPAHSFLLPALGAALIYGSHQPEIFDKTKSAGSVVVQNNVVINNVITVNFIEQQTKQKVAVVKAQSVADPTAVKSGASGQTIAVFDKPVEKPKPDEAPKQVVDLSHAVRDKNGQAPTAGAAAGAAGATSTNKAGGTCAPKDMVNGVCPPDKSKPSGAAPAATGPGAATLKPGDQSPASIAGSKTAAPSDAKPQTADNGAAKTGVKCSAKEQLMNGVCEPKQKADKTIAAPAAAPIATTPNNADQTKTTPVGADQKPKGQAACSAGEQLVNGACESKSNAGREAPSAAKPPDSGQAAPLAPASGNAGKSNRATSTPADNAKAGGEAKCPPNEELVNGVCAPKNKSGGQGNTPQ